MFKRVEKRLRKKEDEEALGLDEDMKEVLGMQDTDSDESESDSESESDFQKEDAAEEAEAREGIDRDGGDNEGGNPEISVEDALKDTIYLISMEPDAMACIVCPGKLLKNPIMIGVHKASNAHRRRFKRFVELAGHASPDDDAWNVMQNDGVAKAKANKGSKRSEKRKAKLAKIKTKRERQKEMKVQAKANQKAKAVEANAAAAPSSDSPDKLQPARKKRKLDGGNSKRNQRQPLPSISRGHKDKGSRNKVSAEGHQRGKMTRKRDKFKMNADWKQSHCGGDSVLKIID